MEQTWRYWGCWIYLSWASPDEYGLLGAPYSRSELRSTGDRATPTEYQTSLLIQTRKTGAREPGLPAGVIEEGFPIGMKIISNIQQLEGFAHSTARRFNR